MSNSENQTNTEQSATVQIVLDLLRNTTLSYAKIGEQVNLSRQRIHQIYRSALSRGVSIPSRDEVERKKNEKRVQQMIALDNEFLETYRNTNDYEQSLALTRIEPRRARFLLRREGYNPNRLLATADLQSQYERQPHTGIHLYVLRDILDAQMTASQIAQKWCRPVPYVFNLMQECRKAGIPIPELPDGRAFQEPKQPQIRTCSTCKQDFATVYIDENGQKHRCFHARVHCFVCLPFRAKKS